ncbi:MAG: gliding motility-associated C-terminal domain-containing protein [Bacteroidales bacterium]|nr:gliding motility-associated C-terminal domain-containing protein [Bacteroidales bacterium]
MFQIQELYWVQVVNDTGCINRDTVNVKWFRQPQLDESNLNVAPTTCNSSTGAITGLTVGGLDPMNYTWKNGSGSVIGSDLDLYHLPVDNYSLWVSDSAGCTFLLKSYTIKNVGDSLILSVDHQDTHCNIDDGIIHVNATAGLSNMLMYSLDTSNFVSNQGLFTLLPPGSYQVWVKDSLGCKKVYDGNPVIISRLPGPLAIAPVIQDETNTLGNGSIQLSASSTSDSLWYSIGGTPQLNNGFFNNLSANTYTCTITDKFGCDTTFTVILKNLVSIRLQAIAGDGSACLGNVAVLPLQANSFSHVSSFDSRLKYNKAQVTCQNYLNANPALADSLQVDLFPALGEISLTWTGKNPVNLPDGSTLVELSFASLLSGQDSLKWDISPGICTFLDSLGNVIAPEFKQGQVRVYSIPQGTIQAPESVCEGSDLSLIGIYTPGSGNGPISYQWSGPDGFTDTNPVTFLSKATQVNAGEYILNLADTNHCQSQVSVQLNVVPLPVADFTKDTVYFDQQKEIQARPGYAHYSWSTGDTSSSITITAEGWYKVTIQTIEGCTTVDSLMALYSFVPLNMPNAFSPNSDGKNDVFRPVTLPEKVKSFTMYIYNRWGQQVYATKDLGTGWNGTIDGNPAPLGVYTYIISYGNSAGEIKKKSGTFTLVR